MKDALKALMVGILCMAIGVGLGFALAATFWDRLLVTINDDKLSNWLSFTGAMLGALATVTAGGLAYLGVLYSHAAGNRDAAVRRITGYLATIREIYAAWLDLKSVPETDPDRTLKAHSLQSQLHRTDILTSLYDSILQEDQSAIFIFCNTLRVGLTTGHPHQKNANEIALYIFDDVTRALTIRKRLLEEGASIKKIQGTKFLTPDPYLKALSSGETADLIAKKAWVYADDTVRAGAGSDAVPAV